MKTKRPRSVVLECEHVLWFRPEYEPAPGQDVYCIKCGDYRKVPMLETHHPMYYPEGNWECYQQGRVARGVCCDCGYTYTARFQVLRTHMERHNLKGCVVPDQFGTITLPPNSPPPF